jgi:hypothetical protein
VLKQLRALVMEARVREDWSRFLPLVQRTMNARANSVTGLAPAHLVLSANLWERVQRQAIAVQPPKTPLDRQLVDVERALEEVAKRNQQDEKKKKPSDPPATLPTWVLVHRERGPKLQPPWKGPCRVITQADERGVVELENIVKKERFRTHVSKLRPFRGATDDSAALMRLAELDDDEYEIEKIVAHHPPNLSGPKKAWIFQVRWVGYGEDFDEWVPYADLAETEKLQEYLADRNKHFTGAM